MKASISFAYYALWLFVYLHLTGCLLFYFYLQTYENSTDYLDNMINLNMLTVNEIVEPDGNVTLTFDYEILEMFRNNTYPEYAGWVDANGNIN